MSPFLLPAQRNSPRIHADAHRCGRDAREKNSNAAICLLRSAGRLKFPPCNILLALSWCWVRWCSCGCLLLSRAGTGSGVLRLDGKKCVVRTASALVRSLPGGIHLARRFLLIQRNLPVAASAGTAGAFTILNRG